MIDVHQGVPMDALKAGVSQALFQYLKRLGCLVSLARSADPDDVAFSIECENLVGVEQKIFSAGFTDDLLHSLPGEQRLRNLLQTRQPLDGLLAGKTSRLLDRFGQPVPADGFQQIVDRAGLEGLQCVLVDRKSTRLNSSHL